MGMPQMKLLIESAMIFFGTLLAAAIVALGEPARADHAVVNESAAVQTVPLMGWHE